MGKFKRILFSAISLLLIFSVIGVPSWALSEVIATGSCGDNVTYTVYADGTLSIVGKGETDNGGSYNTTYSRFTYGDYEDSIKKITVSEGITHLDDYLFASIDSVETITLPSTLTYIGEYVFKRNENLKNLKIPSSVEYIGRGAFESAFDVFGGELVIPEGVKTLGSEIFKNCGATRIILPKSLEVIGFSAFMDSSASIIVIQNKDLDVSNAFGSYDDDERTIIGYTGSSAESVANDDDYDNFEFVSIVCPAPKLVSAVTKGNAVELTWKKSKIANTYTVYRKKSDETSWTKLKTLKSSETTYTDKTAKSGVKYYYTVRASSKWASGKYDKTGIFIKYLDAPEIAVKNSVKGVKISWDTVKGAAEYYVYRKDAAGKKTKIATVTDNYYFDRTAAYGKTYTYYVIAGTHVIRGEIYKSYISNKLDLKVGQIAPVEITDGYVKTQGTVVVSWKAVSGATKYEVYRSTNAKSGYKKIATVTGTSYTDSTVKLGTKYYYKVITIAGSKKSDYSSAKSVSATIPATKFKTSINVTGSSVKLAWEKVNSVDGYVIYRSNGSGWTKIATIAGNSNTTYTYKVSGGYSYKIVSYKKINGKTYYGAGSEAFFRTMGKATIEVDQYGDGFVDIVDWKDVKNATSYLIYRKTGESGSWKKVARTYYPEYVSKVTHGKFIYWKVRAVYTKDGYSSVGDYSNVDQLKIYQRPNIRGWMSDEVDTSGLAFISITNYGDFNLRILSKNASIWNGRDYPSLNGDIYLIDGDALKDGKLRYIDYLDIPSGKSVGVCFSIDGPAKAYYDEDSIVTFYFKYDSEMYKATCNSRGYANDAPWEQV